MYIQQTVVGRAGCCKGVPQRGLADFGEIIPPGTREYIRLFLAHTKVPTKQPGTRVPRTVFDLVA